ncbi:MAG: hypothetical protein RLY88_857 [Actinomycetota bacterium]|jgi:4-hydroxybenzoate polyprenyltransferase
MIEAIRQLFWTSRPISWINTAYPFAITYWLISGSTGPELWVGTLFFLIPYNLMMYGINDVFDYESDLRNPRKGGLEGNLLQPRWHRFTIIAATALSLPFLLYLTFVGTSIATGWLYLFVFTVVAYSAKGLRFKEKPFLDSLTSASHFVGPMIYAVALAGANIGDFKILSMILAFTLWGVASHAFGAVQDVQADREGGIASIATVIGARNTVRFSFAAYLAAGLLVLNAGWPAALAAIAAVPYLVIVGRFWNITDDTCENANAGWKRFIWLNFFSGFVVSLLVIWFAIIR